MPSLKTPAEDARAFHQTGSGQRRENKPTAKGDRRCQGIKETRNGTMTTAPPGADAARADGSATPKAIRGRPAKDAANAPRAATRKTTTMNPAPAGAAKNGGAADGSATPRATRA